MDNMNPQQNSKKTRPFGPSEIECVYSPQSAKKERGMTLNYLNSCQKLCKNQVSVI